MGRYDVLAEILKINEVFPEPQCYLVALLLSSQFQGEVYYNNDHCVTKIDGNYYDKGGLANKRVVGGDAPYLPLELFGIKHKRGLMRALITKHKDL
jgi:hypothetical protein